ncbi:MAG: ComEA family DNA-binding protein [Anaerolinea sp.]|nr:ComEA family DNA-binding protein [Anaerolinea sp.]
MNTQPRLTILSFVLLAVTVIGAAVLLLLTRPAPAQITIVPPAPTATATLLPDIEIYVTGAVSQPNSLITLPHGSRVSDALAAVGGAASNADLARLNLAAILHDGDQVHVFAVGEISAPVTLATPQGGVVIVYINTATLEELETLPGVGAVLAQRIIDYRESVGRFNSMADLDAVEGIGAALMDQLEGLIAFD